MVRTIRLSLALAIALSTTAVFGQIASISPQSFPFGAIEEFVTLRGQNLTGGLSTMVRFTGPGGTFDIEPSVVETTLVIAYLPFDVGFSPGTWEVRILAQDSTGLRTLGPVTFTVGASDDGSSGPPLLFVPEFIFADADSSRGATVEFDIPATSSDGSVNLTPTCTPQSGSLFQFGMTRVQCSVSDANGTSSGEFFVVVVDSTPPVVTVPEEIITDNAVVTYTASAVDNVDGTVSVSCNPPSGATFPGGTTTVVCVAADAHLNYGFGFFNVRVTGGPPLIFVPQTIVEEATSAAGAVVEYEVSTDDESPVTCTPASGSTFALGSTTVSCSATNPSGTSTATFEVQVVDTVGPNIVAPDIIAEATSPAGANVTYAVTATDAVDGNVAVTCTPASGSLFALATPTEVSCSAQDSRGNGNVAFFTVTVVDSTPPAITSLTVSPNTLWPPDHKMVPVTVSITAVDVTDPAPVSTIVSITSNQPINGTGDGDTAPDWQITGALSANLRAERAGSNERVYTITIKTTDNFGNTVFSTITVRVMDSKKRSSR
jgi:HYR domain